MQRAKPHLLNSYPEYAVPTSPSGRQRFTCCGHLPKAPKMVHYTAFIQTFIKQGTGKPGFWREDGEEVKASPLPSTDGDSSSPEFPRLFRRRLQSF